ncbi:Chromosomal replication initiator protein DnaA [Jeotgalibaca dankookensis]|uniref:Chromosomal replication initiator protein DnaA n=1 Tax=Jeotgalibaca dankookensis TaxID=708126 RepID=A0A1S6IRI9_9LACT|nr:chromosomal replication initiator protein DnaA [Jeotgalibaca dankookensis]AQS54167.1 Chromosomal replication initiator protein DnaA [Jeotgalibaca dankookensis]
MEDIYSLWHYLQERFKETLSKVSYDTWIDSAVPIRLTETNIIIEVPSSLHKDYWQNNLATRVVEGTYEFTNREVSPIFMIKNEEVKSPDKEGTHLKGKKPFKQAQLNGKYTFDTFVIGKGNQMAHAAALVVAEEPGTIYNPLFFYGGVGLGKTHLMHAIGQQMIQLRPNAKVKYVSSETFANDFINSIQNRTQEQFRNEYRSVDLLLVDDIQFFADKEGTQEEFFHTFNALYDERKQIVLTSDRLPNEIPKLQERLVSRFAWGLSVDITPPDLETRIAILRNKANSEHLEIPDDTLSYIAGQIDSNIRELEGALVRVQAYSAIQGRDITTSLAADALKSILPTDKPKAVTIYAIQQAVCKFYQLTLEELKGKKRTKNIVVPRQIAMYLCRELTDSSLPKIGQEFGGKDHTTVLHAYDKIKTIIKKDSALEHEIKTITNNLTNK